MKITAEFYNFIPEKLPMLRRALYLVGHDFNSRVGVGFKEGDATPDEVRRSDDAFIGDGHHPDECWPPGRCINPDKCPVVYAVMMQGEEEGLDIAETLWVDWP